MCLALLLPPVHCWNPRVVFVACWLQLAGPKFWGFVHLQNSALHGFVVQGSTKDDAVLLPKWCTAKLFSHPKLIFGFPLYSLCQFLSAVSSYFHCNQSPAVLIWICSLIQEAPVFSSLLCFCCTFLGPYLDTGQAACSRWECLVTALVSSVTGCSLCSSLCYPDAYQLLSSSSPCLAALIKAPLFPGHCCSPQVGGRPTAAPVCFCLPPTQAMETSNSCLLQSSGKVSSLSALLSGVAVILCQEPHS